MRQYLSREVVFAIILIVVFLMFGATAFAWTGPTASAPNSNIGAPVNVGTTAQIKNGDFGANNISAFGNALLSGLGVGTGRYLNFDYTSGGTSGTGSAGYGIRDNAGTLEFKNRSGSWASLQSLIASYSGYWTAGTGGAIYYNGGNIGIGVSSPQDKLDIRNNGYSAIRSIAYSSADVWTSGGIVLMRARGTQASATHPLSGDRIGFYSGANGVNPAAWTGMDIWATENHTNTAQGMKLVFSTTQNGGLVTGTRLTLEQDGVANFTNTVRAPTFLYSSDLRLKENVAPLDQGLVALMKLKPVSFTWNQKGARPGQSDIGLIAQDVEKVLPGIVITDANDGVKGIDYIKLTPILIKAIQEQQKEIDSLKARLDAIEHN